MSGSHRFMTFAVAFCCAMSLALPLQGQVVDVILRVDGDDGSPGGPGTGWDASAFKLLQDCLSEAQAQLQNPNVDLVQIWVASSIVPYFPDLSFFPPPNAGDRNASFELINHVEIYGGFIGDPSETMLSQRNIFKNVTVLSGDIDEDGGLDSFHVVLALPGIDATARLDGFVIRDGFASGGGEDESNGGGLWCAGSPMIVNCTITENSATGDGGGVFVRQTTSPSFINCSISNNGATGNGGGLNRGLLGDVQSLAGSPTLTNCLIAGNFAGGSGGGLAVTSQAFFFFQAFCTASGAESVGNNIRGHLVRGCCARGWWRLPPVGQREGRRLRGGRTGTSCACSMPAERVGVGTIRRARDAWTLGEVMLHPALPVGLLPRAPVLHDVHERIPVVHG